ncbi:MAG: type IV pilus biogenesis/stability protein PilW [Dyella sp.]
MPLKRKLAGACFVSLALSGCFLAGKPAPGSQVPVSGGVGDTAIRIPKTSKADQARDAARIHTELGQRYLQNGDLQGALERLTKALQFDDTYAPAHTVIAVVYERINNPVEAEKHYRRAVELEPKKGDPNNNLGAFLCKIGKGAEAQSYFQRAIADPFYATPDVAWTNAGICAQGAGDGVAAEDDFRKAVALNANNGEALYQLAALLYKRNDAFRARAFLQRYDALGQSSAASLKLGHDIEYRLGNMDAAHDYARRLKGQFPDSEQAHALDATASS